jgi:1-acyl-sn-glycerol-3-phosphate acyltransferase
MEMQKLINRTGATLIGIYMRHALNLDVLQHASLPAGAKILAANHPTTTDPFYLLSLVQEPMYLLITEMAFEDPLLGPMLTAAGHIKVENGNGRAAFDQAVDRLNTGGTIGIFPEGSLSPREGGLCRQKTGTVRLALEVGVPIIPVGIYLDRARIRYLDMTRGDMSETARWYLRGPYAITVGEPMTITGSIEDHDYVRTKSSELADRIAQLSYESMARVTAGERSSRCATQSGSFARVTVPNQAKYCKGLNHGKA